jgi:hypothetical protein
VHVNVDSTLSHSTVGAQSENDEGTSAPFIYEATEFGIKLEVCLCFSASSTVNQ